MVLASECRRVLRVEDNAPTPAATSIRIPIPERSFPSPTAL